MLRDQMLTAQNITVYIKGNYSSPALTATHIHQAPAGSAGPPRLAFPNPVPKAGESQNLDDFSWRASFGCMSGPFRTGIVTNGSEYQVPFSHFSIASGFEARLMSQPTPEAVSPLPSSKRTRLASSPIPTLFSSPRALFVVSCSGRTGRCCDVEMFESGQWEEDNAVIIC